MMTAKILTDYVSAVPFRSFRITMASGQSIEIRHPEMVDIKRSSVRIYKPTNDEQQEKWHDVSLLLMESLEPLDGPAPAWS